MTASFEVFIRDRLLNCGVVSGTTLVTRHGDVVYSYGELKQISQKEVDQFLRLFGRDSNDMEEGMLQPDFIVRLQSGRTTTYKVYQKTLSSMYATSTRSDGGLTVCNLPYGILVCVYNSSTRSGDAIKTIEQFCDIMRR